MIRIVGLIDLKGRNYFYRVRVWIGVSFRDVANTVHVIFINANKVSDY